MAETTRYHRIAPANLQRAIMLVFKHVGSDEREQRLTAEHLVAANLTGHDSHGVGMIPAYLQAVRDKKLTINGRHTVVVDSGPILTIDGGVGMGQVIAYDAMNLGIERARRDGVCILGIRNAHHTGRIGHWAEQCAAAGFVSMHYVAGFAGVTSVAPFGGRETRFQTNPYAAGFPLPGRPPIILDFATSKIAMGKVRVALNKGEPVPENCLIDADGKPTRDPAVMYAPPGKRGALFTFGEHKGSGLAMICELFAGALTGGGTTYPGNYEHRPIMNSMLSIIVEPSRLGGGDTVGSEATRFVDWVKSSKPLPGVEEVLVAGEPERKRRAERERDGIPVDVTTWDGVATAAETVGLARADLDKAAGLAR
ncbi:MAG: malate/lactate/ureidoglycolate dehydrogenase [Alphaproteobacteria bacterium]|nr:malate/lactate/ureidoglycolate dehydrogenase [Alphaproteobacteria bacterium]